MFSLETAQSIAQDVFARCDAAMAFAEPVCLSDLTHPTFERNFTDVFLAREIVVSAQGYTLPGPTAQEAFGRAGSLVEIGAGTGFFSAYLRAMGIDCIATDPYIDTNHHAFEKRKNWEVERFTAIDALKRYPERAVLCCWPSLDHNWANEAIHHIPVGGTLFLIGEGRGGCTGNDALFDTLHRGFEDVSKPSDANATTAWKGIHDHLSVWKKHSP